jgi:NDP-hexose 2,3-enoyl reductase
VRSTQGRAGEDLRRQRPTIENYERLAATLDLAPEQLALGWLLAQPGVTAPVIGPRTTEHLNRALTALDIEPTDDTLAQLGEIFPPIGNGGPAPEAWAW